jgi:hypothetical protein
MQCPLIVLVPGILGSALATPDGKRVFGGLIKTVQRYLRPAELSLDRSPCLEPIGIVPDFSGSPLFTRPVSFPCFGPVPNHGIVRSTLVSKYGLTSDTATKDVSAGNLDADVVTAPYDWRQPMDVSAGRLKDVIDARRRGRRVIVAAHSMGGLVAAYWFACLDGWEVTDSLLTFGTPFRGAPKALQFLGLTRPVFLPRRGGRPPYRKSDIAALRTMPAMFDLVPRYQMVSKDGVQMRPAELDDADWGAQGIADQMQRALRRHHDLDAGWKELADEGRLEEQLAKLTIVGGYDHATWAAASTSTGSRGLALSDTLDLAPGERRDGDGTVPWTSAVPWQMGAVAEANAAAESSAAESAAARGVGAAGGRVARKGHWMTRSGFAVTAVPKPHLSLWDQEVAWKILDCDSAIPGERTLPLPDPSLRGPADEVAVTGPEELAGADVALDVDDDAPTCVPAPVTVRLAERLRPGPQVQVMVQATCRVGAGRDQTERFPLDRDGDRWIGEVGPLAPGTWHLRAVLAHTGVPGQPKIESPWRPVLWWADEQD